ncbi:hypothetical protein [Actinacidiphila oryziradicis]|uniref:hypothetical protein n=1 Tax=Actinacidiphila oryziradicis TaxID=2571141 RepID=UPI0023F38CE4|nr:hypothetical protein [Actinacidiphila oryziradicis]MCW2869801.1 xylB 1 [Actinacidiphila oryziradicis]
MGTPHAARAVIDLMARGLTGVRGRRMVGLTLGDSETQALVPALAELVASGRMPVHKLIRHYRFEEIQQAVSDVVSGDAIKPVLRF